MGTGFNTKALRGVAAKLKPLAARKCPFVDPANIEDQAYWVKAILIAKVSFQEWTKAGRVRQAVFRGLRVDKDGQYIVLSDDEIKAAFPKSTQTIAIEAFVKSPEIDFVLLERPYYLEPLGKAQRVYALLREAMRDAGVMGIARVVMHSKEHLALLIPTGEALVLNTIRWSTELRSASDLALPPAGKSSNQLKPAELKMAAQLIAEMTAPWKSEAYTDTFAAAISELVKQKASAGEAQEVTPLEASQEEAKASNVVDLTELLAKSLQAKKGPTAKFEDAKTAPSKSPVKSAAAKKNRLTKEGKAPSD